MWERDRDNTGDIQFMGLVIELLSAHSGVH